MVMACVANIAMTLSMTGAIFTYFPVYARGVGISTVTIGSLFAWRSIASAAGRIPMGPLSTRLPAHWTLAGVLVVESIFGIPGFGRLAVEAIGARDYQTMQAVMVLFALWFISVQLLVDISYAWINPRIRYV